MMSCRSFAFPPSVGVAKEKIHKRCQSEKVLCARLGLWNEETCFRGLVLPANPICFFF